MIRQSGECVQVDADVDHPVVRIVTGGVLFRAGEEVEEDVGAQLIDRPVLTAASQAACHLVDASRDGRDPVWWEVQAEEVRCADLGWFHHDPTIRNTMSVSGFGFVRIGFDAQPSNTGRQLPRRQPGGDVDDPVHDAPGRLVSEVHGVAFDGTCPAYVDVAGFEQLGNVLPGLQVADIDTLRDITGK